MWFKDDTGSTLEQGASPNFMLCRARWQKQLMFREVPVRQWLSNDVSWCATWCLAKLLLSWSICLPGCVLSRVTVPCSAVALHCVIRGTLLQEWPRQVGTNPEKGHKDAKGIRGNDLWWGKVKRTKCLEPLSLLHGHRNSNGVSCASTEESWIKSLSFYIPIKVTRAGQNGYSSLWTLQKTFSCSSWSSRCCISSPGDTLSLFKNHHRISMRLAESCSWWRLTQCVLPSNSQLRKLYQRPEKKNASSGMAGVP